MAGSAYPSVKIIKRFTFKNQTRDWSNRYHFKTATPADATHWHTLMDNVTAAEKLALSTHTTIINAIGYAAGSDVPVASKSYSLAGTSSASGYFVPGEAAALCRWSTAARTSKNHPVYLFNYFHGALNQGSAYGDQDILDPTMRTELGTYMGAWISGFSDGTNTVIRCGPNGAAAIGGLVEEYLTHRDFPYSPSA